MRDAMRIRTRRRNGSLDVTLLLLHPMESGLRTDAAGRPVPAHYISDATVSVNGQVVLEAILGIAVSRDPLLSFSIQDPGPDATLHVSWRDNRGGRHTASAVVASAMPR
jgi:sulfur-oxidizing protein SoxZ